MQRILPVLLLVFLSCTGALAQRDSVAARRIGSDSLRLSDSVVVAQDSIRKADSIAAIPISTERSMKPAGDLRSWDFIPGADLRWQIMERHPYFHFGAQAVRVNSNVRQHPDKDNLFYALVGLVFLFAILKLAFAKYVNDLFRVFFRTTMKQRQIREQLMQTPLPSLMFNIFFALTLGMYLNFLLRDFGFKPVEHFWIMYLYCCAGVAMIYLVKFLGLKICGWIFNISTAAESYIFIVFIINKMIGIFLLPVIVLLGFSSPAVFSVVMVLSWCGIGMLLLYRFILAFSAVRNEVRFNLFHFILYLAAFEIGPLLLIYRVLLSFV